jgi:hypothetical protein
MIKKIKIKRWNMWSILGYLQKKNLISISILKLRQQWHLRKNGIDVPLIITKIAINLIKHNKHN